MLFSLYIDSFDFEIASMEHQHRLNCGRSVDDIDDCAISKTVINNIFIVKYYTHRNSMNKMARAKKS